MSRSQNRESQVSRRSSEVSRGADHEERLHRLSQDLERTTYHLQLYSEVTRILMTPHSPEDSCAQVLAALREAFHARGAQFLRYDPSANTIETSMVSGAGPREPRKAVTVAWFDSQPGEDESVTMFQFLTRNDLKLREGKVRFVLTPQVSCEITLGDLIEADVAIFFIFVEGKVIGLLAVQGIEASAISSLDVAYFELLASLLALGLQNASTLAETERLATRDSMTGIFNHLYLQEFLDWTVYRCERNNRPLVLVMLDIDDFKKVNDTFGHQTGDQVLRDLAATLQGGIRRSDLVARYGGEEFVVVLPETTIEHAYQLMERIAKSIAHGLKVEADPTYTITASVGMAEWSAKDPISKKDLVERADRAMYFGKRNGKNRIVTWSPEIDQPPLAAQAKAPDDDDPLQSKAFLPLPSK